MITEHELIGLSPLAAGSSGALGAAPQDAGRPNVVFYFPDWVRVSDVGYNGGKNASTPNVDRFALFKMYPSEGQFGLRVLPAKPECVLAKKLLAFRLYAADVEDIRHLALQLNRTTADDLLALLKHYYPNEHITPERVLQVTELARKLHAPSKS
jgi:hypothetical protein